MSITVIPADSGVQLIAVAAPAPVPLVVAKPALSSLDIAMAPRNPALPAPAIVRTVNSKLASGWDLFDFAGLADAQISTVRNGNADASEVFRAAVNSGEDFRIPTGLYDVAETFTLAVAGQTITGAGPRCQIRQQVFGRPVFWLTADECELSGIFFNSPRPKIALPAWTTGDALTDQDSVISRSAAIYIIGANRCHISRLRFDNHVAGIRLRPRDRFTQQTFDNTIERCLFRRYDFGVLGGGQVNAVLDNLHGRQTEFTQGSADPHLIYLPGAGADPSGDDDAPTTPTETLWTGGRIGNCSSFDNAYSSPYKLRNMLGTMVHGNVGRRCARGYDLAYNTDVRIMGFSFTDMPQALDKSGAPVSDVNQAGVNAAYCTDMQISDGLVKVQPDTDVVSGIFLRLNCTRVQVQDTMVDIDFTITAQTRAHYRLVGTVDCVLENVRWRAAGSDKYIIRLFDAEGTRISGTGDQGATSRVLYMDELTTGTVAILDRDTLRAPIDATTVLDLGVGNRVVWRGDQPRFGVHTASGDAPVNGFITVKDEAGVTRKLATIA